MPEVLGQYLFGESHNINYSKAYIIFVPANNLLVFRMLKMKLFVLQVFRMFLIEKMRLYRCFYHCYFCVVFLASFIID